MTVSWNGNAVLASIRSGVMRGLVRGTEAVRDDAVSLQDNSPRSGRWYGKHKASGPGEPPAPDTGTLKGSITTSVDAVNLTGNVNAGTTYSRHLEFGTVKMAPRPFMRPALMNKREEIRADIADEIAKSLR